MALPSEGVPAAPSAASSSSTGALPSAARAPRESVISSPQPPVPGEEEDRLFVALYDYTARSDTEMSFHKGDLFRVRR
jgi:hypothetical protein